jgi:hypothetical protein
MGDPAAPPSRLRGDRQGRASVESTRLKLAHSEKPDGCTEANGRRHHRGDRNHLWRATARNSSSPGRRDPSGGVQGGRTDARARNRLVVDGTAGLGVAALQRRRHRRRPRQRFVPHHGHDRRPVR